MGQDEIKIEVLGDGTIKVQTNQVSPANHMTAEKFLQWIASVTDGSMARTRTGHTHVHEEEHEHEEQKG